MKILFLFGLIVLSFVVNTNDAAAQWYAIPQMQNAPVTCFLVTSDSTLFVGGYFRSLFRSTDDGETWANAVGEIPADTILSLASAGRHIFAGTNAGVFRSSDNGDSWETANTGMSWGRVPINQFANVDTVLYAATDAGVYRTTNFGTSWISENNGFAIGHTPTDESYTVRTIGIVSTPSGLFVTQDLLGGAHVLHSGDTTWKFIGLETHWCDAGALAVLDTVIFAGTWDGVFMYSGKDTTWVPRGNGLQEYLYFCFFATANNLLFIHIGSIGGDIYVTSNFGQTWTPVGGTVFGGASVKTIAANKKYLFAGTENGVWRIPLANVTTVNDYQSQLPAQYVLYQNFPNPFNPSTVINYQMPVRSRVTLKVYDLLGRETVTLVNREQGAGTHSVTFNAGNLLSGVYFYRLQVGIYTDTKKLLLLK